MSKAGRQRDARQRLAEERARAAAAGRRRRAALIGLGAVAAIAVAVVAVVAVRGGGGDGGDAYTGPHAPVTRQADGSVAMARAGVARPVLEIYEDFQCPACESFERATRDTVKELAARGAVRVVYRPFSLFRGSPEPTSGNSLRALNASLCAPAGRWLAFHDRLYDEQGPETEPGFRNEDLIAWAGEVGITDPGFAQCVRTTAKAAQMTQADEAAARAGATSTPTVLLNGEKLGERAAFSAAGLRRAVEAAGS